MMFRNILLPIDLQDSRLAVKAVQISIAEARKHAAQLHVITVLPDFGLPMVASFFPDNALQNAVVEVEKELKKYVRAAFPDDLKVAARVVQGNPADCILAQADSLPADLIIIPSHTKRLQQIFLGSCAATVVQHAKCPVMVIKEP